MDNGSASAADIMRTRKIALSELRDDHTPPELIHPPPELPTITGAEEMNGVLALVGPKKGSSYLAAPVTIAAVYIHDIVGVAPCARGIKFSTRTGEFIVDCIAGQDAIRLISHCMMYRRPNSK